MSMIVLIDIAMITDHMLRYAWKCWIHWNSGIYAALIVYINWTYGSKQEALWEGKSSPRLVGGAWKNLGRRETI